MVRAGVRGADGGAGAGLAGDRHRRARADLRADRLGQDARRVPLRAGPVRRAAEPRADAARLRLAAEGAVLRRREEPARAAARDRRRSERRDPHRRHAAEGAARHGQAPARRADHDAGVAVPDAHEPGARDLRGHRDRDPRRDPRRRADQARRASGDHAWSGWSSQAGRDVQRVGLSATQNPLEEVGRFMVGPKRRGDGGRHRHAQAAGPEDPRAGGVDGRAREHGPRARPVRGPGGDAQVDLAGDVPGAAQARPRAHARR